MSSSHEPWWAGQARALLASNESDKLTLGDLWALCERFDFVHENVELPLLEVDVRGRPELGALWRDLNERERAVHLALDASRAGVIARFQHGELGPAAFRGAWEALGFAEYADRASTAADDYLEGLLHVSRLTTGEPRPASGNVNLASRAQRISEFLKTVEPDEADSVYDLGSGNGKFVTTVAASSRAKVTGVELGASYVSAARDTAARLGVRNAEFICADVRDVDLSAGSVFYLFHPFSGAVARSVAHSLGDLARRKDITVYSQGPEHGYAEFFLDEVEKGGLRYASPRAPGSQVIVLRSAGAAADE